MGIEEFEPLVDLSGFDGGVAVHFSGFSGDISHEGAGLEKVSLGCFHAWDFSKRISFEMFGLFPFGCWDSDILDVDSTDSSYCFDSSSGSQMVVSMVKFETHC